MSRCYLTCYKTPGGVILREVLQPEEGVFYNRGCYIPCFEQVLYKTLTCYISGDIALLYTSVI